MDRVPTHVSHYWRRSRRPFENLSDLEGAALDAVIAELAEEGRQGRHRRVFGPRYMALRTRTEEKMRRLFIDAGGRPERRAPHYFVLGASRWFHGLADDMEVIELAVTSLPDEVTSFTCPDSFTAMGLVADFGLPYEPKPYHGQVFRLSDLETIVGDYGLLPDAGDGDAAYEGYVRRPFEMYVEVQLWSDRPVADLIAHQPRADPRLGEVT